MLAAVWWPMAHAGAGLGAAATLADWLGSPRRLLAAALLAVTALLLLALTALRWRVARRTARAAATAGAPMPVIERCWHCGTVLREGRVLCLRCGAAQQRKRFVEVRTTPPPSPQPATGDREVAGQRGYMYHAGGRADEAEPLPAASSRA